MAPRRQHFVTCTLAAVLLVGSAVPAMAASGDLDPTFSGDGKVISQIKAETWALAVAIQPDGRIVVAGSQRISGVPQITLWRFTSTGAPDPTFGGDGVMHIKLADGASASAIAAQRDGTFIVAGQGFFSGGIVVAKVSTAGVPVASFGSGGVRWVTPDPSVGFRGLAVMAKGRIDVQVATEDNVGAVIYRLSPSGSPDLTWGGDGAVGPAGPLRGFHGSDITVGPAGKLLVAGGTGGAFDVIRLTTGGLRDRVFGGGDGLASVSLGTQDEAQKISTTPTGDIRILGLVAGIMANPQTEAVVGLTRAGAPATSFGSDGVLLVPGPLDAGMSVSSDGSILLAGYDEPHSNPRWAITRILPQGQLDASFGDGGTAVRFIAGSQSLAMAAAAQEDGKIVAVGATEPLLGTPFRMVVARHLA
jgi:uncharacterized delta-60 repeat protein